MENSYQEQKYNVRLKNFMFKIPFNNSQKIERNYSQAGQDLFTLMCLNGKRGGKFLDLGCYRPIEGGNNTYLLEKEYDWTGLSYDINPTVTAEFAITRNTLGICEDCTKLNWDNILNFSTHYDYLSLDLEPASITYQCLESVPFDKIKFSVITYEHDQYRFGTEYKNKAYELLTQQGYIRVCSNVQHNGNAFEDWYINPEFISADILNSFKDCENLEYLHFLGTYTDCTLVSALIPNLNEWRDISKYLELGKDLLRLNVPKVIFLPEDLHNWAREYCDERITKLIPFQKENLYDYFWNELSDEKKSKIQLADSYNENSKKNTLDYFICMNNKPNWMFISKQENFFKSEYFMWLDFGIKHLVGDKINRINELFTTQKHLTEKIIFPSMINNLEDVIETSLNVDKPDPWVTLGGLVLMPSKLVDFFYNESKKILLDIMNNQNKITWEVNIWTKLAISNKQICKAYKVNWDSSIINNLFNIQLDNQKVLTLLNKSRNEGQLTEAIKYYNLLKNDQSFYEKNKAEIDYNMTILFYYTNKDVTAGAKFSVNFINNFNFYENNVWTNLKFYINTLKKSDLSNTFYLKVRDLKDKFFNNSSPCKLIMKNGKEIINVRYVNYTSPTYAHLNGSQFSTLNPIITKNYLNGEILTNDMSNLKKYSNIIQGLEDIRLFEKDDQIKFMATAKQYQENSRLYRIATGHLNLDTNTYFVEKVFDSPDQQECEKNWTMLNENEIIYKWSPLSIYSYDDLTLIKKIDNLPKIFKYFRGSTSCIEIDEFKYCLVHSVHYESPRKYLHWLIKLDQTGQPLAYSIPFDFEGERIEYCLSMNLLNQKDLEFHYSINDQSSKSLIIPFTYFEDKFIEIK